jgi:hypothetical protein
MSALRTPLMTGEDSTSEMLESYLYAVANQTDASELNFEGHKLYIVKSNQVLAGWHESEDDVTDVNALRRTVQGQFVTMAHQLFHLSTAAKEIFPNMRGLTPVESKNLRGYYKKVFRKT